MNPEPIRLSCSQSENGEYSCRIDPTRYPKMMRCWFNALGKLGLQFGVSFDLDFHTIPFHGEDALTQKHYVSKRSVGRKASWLSWPKTQTNGCSAMPMPRSAKRTKTMKFCNSSSTGNSGPAAIQRNWSLTPSSLPIAT